MKNKFTLILTSLLISSLYSCSNEESPFQEVNVNFLETIDLSQIVDGDLEYIPLQTIGDNLLGQAQKLVITEDLIFILDSKIAKQLFVFSKDGLFLNAIGVVGDADGEYRYPVDFVVDDGQIQIFDGSNFTRLVYDRNGDFKFEDSTPYLVNESVMINKSRLLIYSPTNYSPSGIKGDPYVLRIMSPSLEEEYESYFKYEEVLDDAPFPGLLTTYGDEILYSKPIYGNIYSFSGEGGFEPKYHFDFGQHKWPISPEQISNDQSLSEEIFFKGGVMSVVHQISETDNHFVFQSYMLDEEDNQVEEVLDEHIWLGLLFKNKNKCYSIKKVINNIDGGVFASPMLALDNEFIGLINAEELLASKERILRDWPSSPVAALVDTLNEFSNPVLLKYKLRTSLGE